VGGDVAVDVGEVVLLVGGHYLPSVFSFGAEEVTSFWKRAFDEKGPVKFYSWSQSERAVGTASCIMMASFQWCGSIFAGGLPDGTGIIESSFRRSKGNLIFLM
jgi:hypothetical protein